jgi:hypothetical protein
MLRSLTMFDAAMAASVLVGMALRLLGADDPNVVRVGVVLVTCAPAAFFASHLAERFFDRTRARLLQWLMHGALALLLATCILEVIDPSLFTSLAVLQVVLLVSLQFGLTIGSLGLGAAMSMNGFRVRSARVRASVALGVAAAMAATPWLDTWVVSAIVAVVLVVRAAISDRR